jgi:hypothetical protein
MKPTPMIYDPVEIARLEAAAAQLKQALVRLGVKATYKQFGCLIGLGRDAEWSQDDNEKLSMICNSLYQREYHCGAYDASTWHCITWETGSPWGWGGRPWQWDTRRPPQHRAEAEVAKRRVAGLPIQRSRRIGPPQKLLLPPA